MKCLIEYEIEAHGIFDGVQLLQFRHPRKDLTIELREKLIDLNKEDVLLSAYLIFDAESFDEASEAGDGMVSEFIDTLTFVTSMNFRVSKKLRVVDWSPGVAERKMWVITQFPGDERPYKVLSGEVIKTVEIFMAKELPPPIRKSIRWFSTGISAKMMDEKFQCFWFAVELLAQVVKPADKVPDRCAVCKKPLYCENCKSYPTHRPYPKQAIQYIFSKVVHGAPEEAFMLCEKARNCLLHGDDIETVEMELGKSFDEILNIVGQASWYAIWNVMNRLLVDTGPYENLEMFQTNNFPDIVGYATAHMTYTSSNPDNPTIGDWPDAQFDAVRGSADPRT